jgi:hypothetical protein
VPLRRQRSVVSSLERKPVEADQPQSRPVRIDEAVVHEAGK